MTTEEKTIDPLDLVKKQSVIDQWKAEAANQLLEAGQVQTKILKLIELIRKKDEALNFYATRTTWQKYGFWTLTTNDGDDLADRMPGMRARKALNLDVEE